MTPCLAVLRDAGIPAALAVVAALLALTIMMRLLRSVSFTPYVIYRVVLGVILLVIGYTGQRLFAQIIKVPLRLIIPGVLLLCCVGAYMETNSVFSIYVMLAFALRAVEMRAGLLAALKILVTYAVALNVVTMAMLALTTSG